MEKPLVERLHEYVAGDALRLPVFSEIALRLQRLAREEHWEMREVEAAIQSDQVLVAEVLRAANSAFFGGLSPIQSIRGAVVRLGLPQVARLVLLVSEASKYDLLDRELRALAHELWRHAAAVAMAAGWLARRLNYGTHEEDAFIGGLLHDVGKLAILAGLDEIGRKERLPLSGELTREVLATTHAEVGVRLLTHWSLPDVYRRIVRDHHAETFDAGDVPLCLVRLANQATRKIGFHLHPEPTLVLAATPEAHALRAGEVLLAELEVALEDAAPVVTRGDEAPRAATG
jgi:putative nucleotidyltransferase with HDIG domain